MTWDGYDCRQQHLAHYQPCYHPVGLLGVLVEAKYRGLVVSVRPIMDDLIEKAGFWISQPLYKRVLQAVNE